MTRLRPWSISGPTVRWRRCACPRCNAGNGPSRRRCRWAMSMRGCGPVLERWRDSRNLAAKASTGSPVGAFSSRLANLSLTHPRHTVPLTLLLRLTWLHGSAVWVRVVYVVYQSTGGRHASTTVGRFDHRRVAGTGQLQGRCGDHGDGAVRGDLVRRERAANADHDHGN